MRPVRLRRPPLPLALVLLTGLAATPAALAQPHHHTPGHSAHQHSGHAHAHDLGPAGATYDLRFLDAMVEHHTGALRMSEVVRGIGSPGVGALARQIWDEQAREIRAMRLWRRAWYPDAPTYPVALEAQGDPDSREGLRRMGAGEIEAMRMMGALPDRDSRVVWFLEGMLLHHGAALVMAHDALDKSSNPTLRRLSRQIIVAQRAEIITLRRMLRLNGLDKPEYRQFDPLFSLR